jgi:tetratricopeptide (TPR) repeat protein
MVKLHVLHFAPVVVVFLLVDGRADREARDTRLHLVLSFLAGLVAATVFWLVAVYAGHSEILAKYFKSNVILSQSSDYSKLSITQALTRRLGGLMHVGAGRDGYFVKIPEIAIAAFLGLLGVVSRFSWRRQASARWETLAGIWFVGLVIALSLLSYRPLRYLALFTPSVCLLAASLLLRLARGEPWLASERPRWFPWVFGAWLAWVALHLQQDVVFQIMTGGRSIVLEGLNDFQKSLYRYQFAILLQLLIWGGVSFLITFFLKGKLASAPTVLPARQSRRLFLVGLLVVVALNGMRFAGYALDRKYSIVETARSLERILSDHVFLVGDCANTVSLETRFDGLPSYGDMMRYKETAEFGRYPVTHFLLRYPALFNYLKENYPDFMPSLKPIRLYGLCGREATLVRFENWPGYPSDSYKPSVFEQGTDLLNEAKPDEAIEAFQAFLERRPDSYEAIWGLAVSELQKGDAKQARAYIERSLELTRTDALSYEVYADVLEGLGQHELAVKYWNTALEFSPGNRRVLRKIGAAVSDAGEELNG